LKNQRKLDDPKNNQQKRGQQNEKFNHRLPTHALPPLQATTLSA
jgi:hypothetical protein